MAVVDGYTTLAAMKEWLELVDPDDTELDSMIEDAINAASRGIDNHCHRFFFRREAVRQFGSEAVITTRFLAFGSFGDLVSLDGVLDGDQDVTMDVSEWPLDRIKAEEWPVRGLLRSDGRWSRGRVQVDGVWGWPEVPESIRQATVLQSSRLVKRRKSPEGVVGMNTFGAVRLGRLDPDVKRMIRPYRYRGNVG